MKKKYYCILIITLFSILVNIAYSVPAPHFLALNHETKECARYWPGDEFTYYELPSGWKSYYINHVNGSVETEIGNCNFINNLDDCCNQLNYTYVSDNIGIKIEEKPPTGGPGEALIGLITVGGIFLGSIFLFIFIPIAIFFIFIFIIKKKVKNKTLKQLLDPDRRKIMIFIFIIIFKFFLFLFAMLDGEIPAQQFSWIIFKILDWPIYIHISGWFLDLIWLYLLSCLISWIYDKVKKK